MINRIIVEGRLTGDPVKKTSKNGKDIATFSIANEVDFGEKHANFFNCVVWGKLSEVVNKFCKKGATVIVDGVLRQDSFKNKNGQNQQYYSITVEKIRFFGEKKENENKSVENFEDIFAF